MSATIYTLLLDFYIMEQQDIHAFMTDKVLSGTSKRDIHEQLSAVGWSDDEIDAAYAQALVHSGVPVPHDGAKGLYAKKSSAVEVVLNLFSFILLGVVATALGTLYFGVINYFFPDTLRVTSQWRVEQAREAIHYAMAALIIGFPLYYLTVRMWFKAFRESEGKVEAKLTKWITYLVLLVASVVVVGDLIAILNTFLQGEISMRFFLKGLTILVIAGGIFSFYFMERKKIQYRKDIPQKTFQLFGWSLLGVIIVGIVLGFVAAGTPSVERERTFDTQRSSDLQELANCITNYTQEFGALPENLDMLESSTRFSYCSNTVDPETNSPYEYRIVSPLTLGQNNVQVGTIELCATFALPNSDTRVYSKWHTHGAGRECDTERISVTNDTPIIKPLPVTQTETLQ
jgi:membrane protein YqaA with SNARE-associated domain